MNTDKVENNAMRKKMRNEYEEVRLRAQKLHEEGKKLIMVDIDGTICDHKADPKDSTIASQNSFAIAEPFKERINFINQLYDEGHWIMYWTARGCYNGKDYFKETEKQLRDWGCRFSELNVYKPAYDLWIDDKGVGVNRYQEDFLRFQNDVLEGLEKC